MQLIDQNYLDKHQGPSKGPVWSTKLVWLKLPKFWVTKVLHCQSFLQVGARLFMSRREIRAALQFRKGSNHCQEGVLSLYIAAVYAQLSHHVDCIYGLCTKTPVKGVQDGPWGLNSSLCSMLVFPNSQQIWIFKFWNKKSKFPEILRNSRNHVTPYFFLNFIYIVKIIILTILENNVKQCIIFCVVEMLKISEVFCKKNKLYILQQHLKIISTWYLRPENTKREEH